jgi:hypothetical protein
MPAASPGSFGLIALHPARVGSIRAAPWTSIVMTGIPFSLESEQVPEVFVTGLSGIAGHDTK